MFVNRHARYRLGERLLPAEAEAIVARLEAEPGTPGLAAVILGRVAEARGDRRSEVELRESNGDVIVAIVDEGEVTTVYYRRSWDQRLDADGLGVDRVDWLLEEALP